MSRLEIDPATGPVQRVQIQEIAQGDTFVANDAGDPIWVAQSDVQKTSRDEWVLRVQFVSDGGIDNRVWSGRSANFGLRMRRPPAPEPDPDA